MGSPAENLEQSNDRQVIDIGYRPHRIQQEIHERAKRFTVVVSHRRMGKTYCACAQLVDAALRTKKQNARFGLLSPFLKQSKQAAWGYLRQFTAPIAGVTVHESELTIRFPNGATITLYGGDNADALRGGYFDGLVIDEVADLKPDVYGAIIRPSLADRKGWCFFIGTPRGVNLFYDLYQGATSGFVVDGQQRRLDPEWIGLTYRVDETNLIDAKELESSRTTMSPAQYRQEFLCDFSASQDNVLITIDLVSQACQRMVVLSEVQAAAKIIGVDVARFGDDRSVIVRRKGLACFEAKVFQGLDNMDLAARVANVINTWNPDAVFIDAGRGEGVIDRLRQLGYSVIEVNFGGKATDDSYANKRTEIWDLTAKPSFPTCTINSTGPPCAIRSTRALPRLKPKPGLSSTNASPLRVLLWQSSRCHGHSAQFLAPRPPLHLTAACCLAMVALTAGWLSFRLPRTKARLGGWLTRSATLNRPPTMSRSAASSGRSALPSLTTPCKASRRSVSAWQKMLSPRGASSLEKSGRPRTILHLRIGGRQKMGIAAPTEPECLIDRQKRSPSASFG
jgi:hypothetical protein